MIKQVDPFEEHTVGAFRWTIIQISSMGKKVSDRQQV